MTPDAFLEEVVQPNMETALRAPCETRAIVNAILTIDALAGILHAELSAVGKSSVPQFEDDRYRDELARVSPSFRILRDAAASIKHGALTPARKKIRLLRRPDAIVRVPNACGLFQCGDAVGSQVIVIEFEPGPGYVRASNVIADSYRMLKRIVHGDKPRKDEHDRGTILSQPTDPAFDVIRRMEAEIAGDEAKKNR